MNWVKKASGNRICYYLLVYCMYKSLDDSFLNLEMRIKNINIFLAALN